MAMAKLVALLAMVLVTICMANTMALAKVNENAEGEYHLASRGEGSLRSYQCPGQCTRRCSQTQYHKPCIFFCQKCCMKCLCVPSGFYGNKHECPCYNNWKTKRGGPKCP